MNIKINTGLTVANGETIGRDPRTMAPADFIAVGHTTAPILDIIRASAWSPVVSFGPIERA